MPVESVQANQGFARKITLAAGAVATVNLDKGAMHWGRAGLSWIVKPADGASVTVEHSLQADGEDDWVVDQSEDHPFEEDTTGEEGRRIQRLRFSPTGGGCVITVLASAPFNVEES